jgi:hypothetical protein
MIHTLDWLLNVKIILLVVQRVFAAFGTFLGIGLNYCDSEGLLIHLKLRGMPKATLSVLADDR